MTPIVSPLSPLVLMSILSMTYGQNSIGESCVSNNSASVCKHINDCPQVDQKFSNSKMINQTCEPLDNIVCCPTTNSVINDPIPEPQPEHPERTTTSQPMILESGKIAKKKCEEYANKFGCLKFAFLGIGGKIVYPREFPFMAAVGFGNRNNILWFCGGSLISSKIVLTAAHCAWSPQWGNATWVRLGDLNLIDKYDDAMSQTIAIAERIRHPDYIRPLQYHDIAILRLKEEANYTAYVRPACLPVVWPDIDGNDYATATGWGQVGPDEKNSDDLLKMKLKLISHASCNATYFDGTSSVELPSGIVDDWQICAGEVGIDTCLGDSGGPLVVFNTNHECIYNVIGVTSLGRECGSIIPGVYTRIYYYITWIEKTAWPEYFKDIV